MKLAKTKRIQDHDGSHIKGLLINFLDHFYPSLLKIPEFLVEFITPIVRVTKGNHRKDFFTIPEYEKWLEETPDARKWHSKYYKVSKLIISSQLCSYVSRVLVRAKIVMPVNISATWVNI